MIPFLRPKLRWNRVLRDATRRLVLIALVASALFVPSATQAEDVSQPAILQVFEARWDTIEDRMADIFNVGYGRMWVPPPGKGGSGFSVGYDVFDPFDLGSTGNETHYGTAATFRRMVQAAHAAGVAVNTDLIWNHSGVGNRNDANFVALGGYPGFALTLPGDINGDYHDPFIDALSEDQILGQLAGLNDIAQEKNHQFIRHPVTAGDPNNIPAGSMYNKPNANNARLYPDRDLGGTQVFDPYLGSNVTLYDFNPSDPLAGDAVQENALGLLMRNVRWMVQEFDVDGFRLDAARHYPRWVLNYFDQASFLAKQTPLLDGSQQHVFSFIETGGDSAGFIQDFIRKDINNANLGQVGGNRDVLDFNLFYALRNNLSENGISNNWHSIRNASIDLNDDGLHNGSQGVSFVNSHDEQGAFLSNVAHAYTLMMPGNALVYLNAEQYGPTGDFPKPGKDDALGGYYGETITKLVEVRNTHGRGNFHERWLDDAFNPNGFSNVYIFERSQSAIVGLNSRNDSVVETRSGVQTNFAPGTILVELTGNAADSAVDPGGVIPDTIKVNGSGQVNVSIPANNPTGRGYVIYGLATPQGTLSLSNVAGTLAGGTATAATNGTTRLEDIAVIRSDSFQLQLNTTPVSLADPDNPGSFVRDVHADGDTAQFKIDGGLDLNNLAGVDHVTPGSVSYGFEDFTDVRVPGYINNGSGNIGTGSGAYAQEIDATQLAEGRHYVTVRAFRHRDAGTGGDGGPAVFEDFKQTIYIDRLAPESQVVSFDPFASHPTILHNRDLIVRSVDQTASNVHLFLDLPESVTDEQLIAMAQLGQQQASQTDLDAWKYGFFAVPTGNHVATIVTFEPSFDGIHGVNVQRVPGLFANTNFGAGFGDLDSDGVLEVSDVAGLGNNSFEDVLYSQNSKFDPAADLDGDGDVDNLDLFALGPALGGAAANVLAAYDDVLLGRGDVNNDGQTNIADLVHLYSVIGQSGWLEDLDVDGLVTIADIQTFVEDVLRTSTADFNLDGQVNGADFLVWQRGQGAGDFSQGDADFNGQVNAADLAIWQSAYAAARVATNIATSAVVPEPATATGLLFVSFLVVTLRGCRNRLRAVEQSAAKTVILSRVRERRIWVATACRLPFSRSTTQILCPVGPQDDGCRRVLEPVPAPTRRFPRGDVCHRPRDLETTRLSS